MTDLSKRLEAEQLLSSGTSSLNDEYPSSLSNNKHRYDNEQSYDSFPDIDENESPHNPEKVDDCKPDEYVAYKRRWYILILFSLVAFTQSGTWNTWGPIADTTKAVLGWTDADIALLTNWGPIAYVVSAPLFSWIMDVKGLKMSMLFTSTLQMIGVAIRCIPVPVKYLKWVMNIGHFFIGLAGPILMAGGPLLSAAWYPPHQRTTSTAIAANGGQCGVAFAFLIGPLVVSEYKWENSTEVMNAGHIFIGLAGPVLMAGPPLVSAVWFPPHQRTTSTAFLSTIAYLGVACSFLIGPIIVSDINTINSTAIVPPVNQSLWEESHPTIIPSVKNHHIQEIKLLMYIEAGFMLILFIMTWAYFPSRPPTPPSASADTKREDFIPGAKILFTSAQFWLPALCYSISTGVYNVWGTQLDTIFQNTVQVGQDVVGWIGFYSNIAGVVGSLVLAMFVDHLGGKMKMVLLLIVFCGVACGIWIMLICLEVIAFNMVSLYVSVIVFATLVNAAVPLYFEVTVEGTYPVAEGITAMIMTWLNNLYGLLFLLIMMIPSIGVLWMNYVAIGAMAVCIPLLLLYEERYNRLKQDTAAENG